MECTTTIELPDFLPSDFRNWTEVYYYVMEHDIATDNKSEIVLLRHDHETNSVIKQKYIMGEIKALAFDELIPHLNRNTLTEASLALRRQQADGKIIRQIDRLFEYCQPQ